MPMCDAYIPSNALEPAAERELLRTVTDVLVSHELRRIVDLMDDPTKIKASHDRATSIAWIFVHRTETYVAGNATELPYYKFVVSIPEGQLDDVFVPAINRDIYKALEKAEGGRYPHLRQRLWVFNHEIKDGSWGAGGRPMYLEGIIDFVAPEMGALAVRRWETKKASEEKLPALGAQSKALR